MQFKENKKIERMVCGGLSGVCSKTLLLPLDLIKKRLQVQGFAGRSEVQYRNVFHCASKIVQEEGFRAFYRGAVPSVLKVCLIFFTTYYYHISLTHFVGNKII